MLITNYRHIFPRCADHISTAGVTAAQAELEVGRFQDTLVHEVEIHRGEGSKQPSGGRNGRAKAAAVGNTGVIGL